MLALETASLTLCNEPLCAGGPYPPHRRFDALACIGRALPGRNRLRLIHHAFMALLTALAILASSGNASNDDPTAQAVKAAFLFNFAKFSAWPDDAFASRSSPIVICAFRDSLADSILDPLAEKMLHNRPVEARRIEDANRLDGCHLFYTAAYYVETGAIAATDLNNGAAMLSVSDSPGFSDSGGQIELVQDGGRLRFRINLAAVERSGMSLSSKLLNLAEIVEESRR